MTMKSNLAREFFHLLGEIFLCGDNSRPSEFDVDALYRPSESVDDSLSRYLFKQTPMNSLFLGGLETCTGNLFLILNLP